MVKSIRKKAHSVGFKFKIVLAAVKAGKNTAELYQDLGIVNGQLRKGFKYV